MLQFKAIEIIANCLYSEDDPLLNQFPFKKLMICVTLEFFVYKDCLNKQIDRVAMGFPSGPTSASSV